jgi:hypothetical protein
MSESSTRGAAPAGASGPDGADPARTGSASAAAEPMTMATIKREMTLFSERFGHLMSRILLTALYVILVAPAAVFIAFLTDPLRIKRFLGSTYSPWRSDNTDLEHARRQD